MPYLLNIVYLLLVTLLSPYLLFTAIRKGKYRSGLMQKWFGLVPPRQGDRRCIWLHAVSVGEVNLLAPLLKQLITAYPTTQFVISTTSRTGHELACKKYAEYQVIYAPLDFTWAVKTAMARIRPDMLIIAELELWPNLIWAAKRYGAKVAVFNGRLSEKSFRGYCWLKPLVSRVLARIDVIAAQNETYAKRFIALGAAPACVHVTGSIKFDGAETNRQNPRTKALAKLAGIAPDDIIFLAGSTQSPEEVLALETYRQLQPAHPRLRLILVPRHPERFDEVAKLLTQSGVAWARRSQLDQGADSNRARVLLVDVIGELGAWWGTAQIGFVGGSLLNERGGQNMLEPAAYGVATCFGPNTRNFRDIVSMMLEHEAAVVVHSAADLIDFVRRTLEDAPFAERLNTAAQALVRSQWGATTRTVELLARQLKEAPSPVEVRQNPGRAA